MRGFSRSWASLEGGSAPGRFLRHSGGRWCALPGGSTGFVLKGALSSWRWNTTTGDTGSGCTAATGRPDRRAWRWSCGHRSLCGRRGDEEPQARLLRARLQCLPPRPARGYAKRRWLLPVRLWLPVSGVAWRLWLPKLRGRAHGAPRGAWHGGLWGWRV
jgi:hypothetical protein